MTKNAKAAAPTTRATHGTVRRETVDATELPNPPAGAGHRTWCEINNADPTKRRCNCSPDGKGYAATPARAATTEASELTVDELDQLEAVYRERLASVPAPQQPDTIEGVLLRLIREVRRHRGGAR